MLKFLRKHNKKLLAVFMALLLVVWLGGSALEQIFSPDQSAMVAATSKFGEIKAGDLRRAEAMTNVLASLGMPWSSPGLLYGYSTEEPLTLADWILLSREADSLGFTVSPEEAAETLNARGATPALIYNIADRYGLMPEDVHAAVAQFQGVLRAVDAVAEAAQVSEAQVRVRARDALEKAKTRMVVYLGNGYRDTETPVSEEELQEVFNQYRDQSPSGGLNFGYLLPAKVKVQYVRVNLDAVNAGFAVNEDTLERAARKYWKDNRDKDEAFLRPPPKTPTTQPDEAASQPSDPATQPADAASQPVEAASKPAEPESKYFKTFTEAREAALGVVRKQLVQVQANKLAEWVVQRSMEAWFDATRGDDGYRKLPPGQDQLDVYEKLTAVPPPDLSYPGALTIGTTDWFAFPEAGAVPEIGKSWLEVPGRGKQYFGTLAFQVQGLREMPEGSAVDTSFYLARYESPPLPLRDELGNLYVYRVIDVRPAQPPATVDEVRDQVVKDVQLKHGFEAAQKAAEALLAQAREVGLEAAWNASPESQEQPATHARYAAAPPPFPREPLGLSFGSFVPGVGFIQRDFAERCFALGESSAANGRIGVIPLPAQANVAVVECEEIQPMTTTAYVSSRPQVVSTLASAGRQKTLSAWLDPELIRSRNKFERTR